MILVSTEIKMVGFIKKESGKIASSTTLIAPCSMFCNVCSCSMFCNAGSVTLLGYSLVYKYWVYLCIQVSPAQGARTAVRVLDAHVCFFSQCSWKTLPHLAWTGYLYACMPLGLALLGAAFSDISGYQDDWLSGSTLLAPSQLLALDCWEFDRAGRRILIFLSHSGCNSDTEEIMLNDYKDLQENFTGGFEVFFTLFLNLLISWWVFLQR